MKEVAEPAGKQQRGSLRRKSVVRSLVDLAIQELESGDTVTYEPQAVVECKRLKSRH